MENKFNFADYYCKQANKNYNKIGGNLSNEILNSSENVIPIKVKKIRKRRMPSIAKNGFNILNSNKKRKLKRKSKKIKRSKTNKRKNKSKSKAKKSISKKRNPRKRRSKKVLKSNPIDIFS